jgi:ABC-type Fe2+-enterobactin transport system substrate-binding protein
MIIKSYLEFIKESNVPPGPDVESSVFVTLTDDEIYMFREEPILSNLISSQKAMIVGNQLYYYDDKQVIDSLNQFFPEKIVNTIDEYDREIDNEK